MLGTIKSRTHHYPFRLIPPAVLRPYLEQLAAAEGVKVEPAVFPLVVRAGGGSARDIALGARPAHRRRRARGGQLRRGRSRCSASPTPR